MTNSEFDPFPPDRSPDHSLALEAKVNTVMQGLLALCIRYYAPVSTPESAIQIQTYEVIRDSMRLGPEEDPSDG